MSENFDLWNPWSYPEVFITLFRQLKLLFEAPNDSAAQLFESKVHSVDTPLLPDAN